MYLNCSINNIWLSNHIPKDFLLQEIRQYTTLSTRYSVSFLLDPYSQELSNIKCIVFKKVNNQKLWVSSLSRIDFPDLQKIKNNNFYNYDCKLNLKDFIISKKIKNRIKKIK